MSKEGRRLALSSKSIAKSASRLMAGWGATNSYRPHKNLCKKVRTVALLTRINLDSTKHTVRVEIVVERIWVYIWGGRGVYCTPNIFQRVVSWKAQIAWKMTLDGDPMLLLLHFVQTVSVKIDQHYILHNWLGIPFSFVFCMVSSRKWASQLL